MMKSTSGTKKELWGNIPDFCKRRLYMNTYMNITDNNEIEIENCRRIIEYNDVCIRLRTTTLTVCVWGEKLRISDYRTGGVIISGKISSVELERERR